VESENKIYILYKKWETEVIMQITLFHFYPLGMALEFSTLQDFFFFKCTVLCMVGTLILHTETELPNSNFIAEGNTQEPDLLLLSKYSKYSYVSFTQASLPE